MPSFILALFVSIASMQISSSQWIVIANESVGDAGSDQFRVLDFNDEIYANYDVSQISQYKIEWDFNDAAPSGYNEQVTFKLNIRNPNTEIFTDETVDQDIYIDIVSSTITSLTSLETDFTAYPNKHIFCKQCSRSSTAPDKYGDTCWAVLPYYDHNRECGCSAVGWEGTGLYYGGWPAGECTHCDCHGGAFAGVKSNADRKGGLASVGVQISILLDSETSQNPQREIIWSEAMNTEFSGSGWQTVSLTNLAVDLVENNDGHTNGCIMKDATADCWDVDALNAANVFDDNYIYTSISTEGYENIALIYNMDPWAQPDSGPGCYLFYSTDDAIIDANSWTQIGQRWDSSDHIRQQTQDLDASADDNAVLIKVVGTSGGGGAACYVSDFVLTAQAISTTSMPTKSPTDSPTETTTLAIVPLSSSTSSSTRLGEAAVPHDDEASTTAASAPEFGSEDALQETFVSISIEVLFGIVAALVLCCACGCVAGYCVKRKAKSKRDVGNMHSASPPRQAVDDVMIRSEIVRAMPLTGTAGTPNGPQFAAFFMQQQQQQQTPVQLQLVNMDSASARSNSNVPQTRNTTRGLQHEDSVDAIDNDDEGGGVDGEIIRGVETAMGSQQNDDNQTSTGAVDGEMDAELESKEPGSQWVAPKHALHAHDTFDNKDAGDVMHGNTLEHPNLAGDEFVVDDDDPAEYNAVGSFSNTKQ